MKAKRRTDASVAAQERAERAIRSSWRGMHTNARRADADEPADQVAADDYLDASAAVAAAPTTCEGLLCPACAEECDDCELRLEKVLFQ